MSSPPDGSVPPGILASFTPDSSRWRRQVAGLAAIGALLAFYAAFAIASGVKSGIVYNLLILLFGVLTLVLPAVATAVLLAPDSGRPWTESSSGADSIETLKQRYAAGEIDHAEFDRRLDDLVGIPDDLLDHRKEKTRSEQPVYEHERDSTGT